MSCEVSISSRSTPPWIRPSGLLAEDVDQFIEGDIGELGVVGGGQLAGGADRAGDKPLRLARPLSAPRVFVGEAAGQRGRRLVDLDDPVLQAVFLHRDAVGAEGVRLDHVHADLEERAVDLSPRPAGTR